MCFGTGWQKIYYIRLVGTRVEIYMIQNNEKDYRLVRKGPVPFRVAVIFQFVVLTKTQALCMLQKIIVENTRIQLLIRLIKILCLSVLNDDNTEVTQIGKY